MNKTLYEISGDFRSLYDLLEESGGEVTDETEAAFDAIFREVELDRVKKLEAYGWVMQQFLDEMTAIQQQEERLRERAARKSKAYNRLKQRIHEHLKATDTDKVETISFTFRRQKNGGKSPVILKDYYRENPVELPEEYRKVVFQPDLEKLRAHLEELGEDSEAAEYADLGERGEHLRIS